MDCLVRKVTYGDATGKSIDVVKPAKLKPGARLIREWNGRTHRWFDELAGGEAGSAREIARRDGIDASEVGRTIQLAFLALDFVETILAGHQPVELTARHLTRGVLLVDWQRQRGILGFAG